MKNQVKVKELKAIYKFFGMRHYSTHVKMDTEKIDTLVSNYCLKEHNFKEDVNECAKLVQKHFNDFVDWVNIRSTKEDRS